MQACCPLMPTFALTAWREQDGINYPEVVLPGTAGHCSESPHSSSAEEHCTNSPSMPTQFSYCRVQH
eukprot:1160650-Pelagomonas_calceolata.AAC.2